MSPTTPAEPDTNRAIDGHAQSAGSEPTLTNRPCTMAAASPATTVARATASTAPVRLENRESSRRDTHSSTVTASPSHSA